MIDDLDILALRMITKEQFENIHHEKPHEFDMVPDMHKTTCYPSMRQVVTEEYCEDYQCT